MLVHHAYSDKQANTLHIMPVYEWVQKEEHEKNLRAMDESTIPHKHNFMSGFINLGLALRDSCIICYRVDENSRTAKATPNSYGYESDKFVLDEMMEYEQNQNFVKEVEKSGVSKISPLKIRNIKTV